MQEHSWEDKEQWIYIITNFWTVSTVAENPMDSVAIFVPTTIFLGKFQLCVARMLTFLCGKCLAEKCNLYTECH
jgi:hypothetical protein